MSGRRSQIDRRYNAAALNALAGGAPKIRERRNSLLVGKEELERGLELCQKFQWRSGGAGALDSDFPAKNTVAVISNGVKGGEH